MPKDERHRLNGRFYRVKKKKRCRVHVTQNLAFYDSCQLMVLVSECVYSWVLHTAVKRAFLCF